MKRQAKRRRRKGRRPAPRSKVRSWPAVWRWRRRRKLAKPAKRKRFVLRKRVEPKAAKFVQGEPERGKALDERIADAIAALLEASSRKASDL